MKHSQEVYHKNPRRHLEKIQEVMAEPVTNAEIKEGTAMLKEREKLMNKPEGTLTTGRPAPKSKEEFENKIKPLAKKRAQDSRASRGERQWS
jgi:1-acyl-sn-glycerol-3-phosphate acyltransferase